MNPIACLCCGCTCAGSPAERLSLTRAILRAVEASAAPMDAVDVQAEIGGKIQSIRTILCRLAKDGELVRSGHGFARRGP